MNTQIDDSVTNAKIKLATGDGGVDISHWNSADGNTSVIQFHTMQNAGKKFLGIKAAEGEHNRDACFNDFRERSEEVGFLAFPYFFMEPLGQSNTEAENFIDAVGLHLKPNEPTFALDAESFGKPENWAELSRTTRIAKLNNFLLPVSEHYGVRPIIYTSPGWWNSMFSDADFSWCDLWVAHYNVSKPSIPHCWLDRGYMIWQYSEFGTVPGGGAPKTIDTDVWRAEGAFGFKPAA